MTAADNKDETYKTALLSVMQETAMVDPSSLCHFFVTDGGVGWGGGRGGVGGGWGVWGSLNQGQTWSPKSSSY